MTNHIKENFDGDLNAALKAGIESPITSPTTKALLEWVREVLADQGVAALAEYNAGYADGYENAMDFVDLDPGDNYTGPTYMEYDD